MEQEKQIEEMTEVVKREIDYGKKWIPDKYEPVELTIYPDDIAYAFYNAGYRKERQGEWVKPQFLSRTGFFTIREFTCNQCNKFFEVREGNEFMNYCPNCGAKMKGIENE